MKRAILLVVAIACVAGLAMYGHAGLDLVLKSDQPGDLPLAIAHKGEFLAIIRCRGELRAARSVSIYAPMVPNLRIAWMAPAGEPVEAGQPVIRFDSSSAQQQLIQKEAALAQAQASLDQAAADARAAEEHSQGDIEEARLAVEKARLQNINSEFISRIDAEQNRINLTIAEQQLKVQEAKAALTKASNASKIAGLERQRINAKAEIDLIRSRMAQMEIRAPLTGSVVFASNYNQGPLNAKPFKVGDSVFSGMNLAEIPDLNSLQMDARVEETDRGRITVGQEVRVRVDALPELEVTAKIAQISALAELTTNEYPPTRSFRAYAAMAKTDERLRPGMNASMDIVVERIADAISLPAKALFTHGGKPVVYLSKNGAMQLLEVKLLARNPDEVAVEGIADGATVSLTDPEAAGAKK